MKLKDIVKIKGGKRLPKGENLQTLPNSHPYIRVKDMKDKYIVLDELEYVPDDVFLKIKNYIVSENDVLISIVGTIGEVCIIDKKLDGASQTENCAKLSGIDAIDAQYLYYFLKSTLGQEEIKKAIVGAVQPKLPLYGIENIEIDWKDRSKRESIVNSLATIDDKIQLNTQTNQTLEQIAQAIYKSWFVDYEPTRAKAAVLAAGGSKAEAETAAMRAISSKTAAELVALAQNHPARYQQLADLAAAFPAALVPTDDFGEIPEGWEVKPLPEIIDFMEGPGIRNWQYTDAEDGVRFINIRCIQNGDIVLDKANKITKEEAFGKYAHFQLREDDIVVSASGTLGRFAFIRKEHLPLCLNTSVIRFRPIKQKSTIGFIEGFIAGQLQYELETRASGSAQRNFGPMHLKQISIVTPEYELLSLHQYYISELYHKRKFTLAENDNLLHIRDLLLPKLLKGDV